MDVTLAIDLPEEEHDDRNNEIVQVGSFCAEPQPLRNGHSVGIINCHVPPRTYLCSFVSAPNVSHSLASHAQQPIYLTTDVLPLPGRNTGEHWAGFRALSTLSR